MKKNSKQASEKNKYYSLSPILSKNCDYNIVFGERSNGKTYAALLYGIEQFCTNNKQFAYIRRWREDIRGKRSETLFAAHVQSGAISKASGGKYNAVMTKGGKYYLANVDDDGNKEINETPFCYSFALSEQEHEKSTSYPNVTTIIFDEFLTRRYYLPDEFMLFMNLLSTIIRQRNDVKIIMLGNTVNKYCPYFNEMGLKNVANQKQGTIDIYEFGKDGVTVAVEYAATIMETKASNKYFAFDNQNLQMITSGKWEMAVYPRLPRKYKPSDVVFIFYIEFEQNVLQGNVISTNTDNFIYIHAKTTEIKDRENNVIYTLHADGNPYHRRKLVSNATDFDTKITKYFATDRVFYQSNEIGEIVRNYIKLSVQNNLLN